MRHRIVLIVAMLLAACDTSSPETDAGTMSVDAGTDAARADTGTPEADAGTELDAGVDDAAVELDASSEPDAGVEPDAGTATPVMPAAAGDLVITEIQAAPAGYADDSLAEWVELHNPSETVTYDLAGCVFADKPADDDFVVPTSVLVPPGAYVVLSSAAFTVATHGFESDVVYGTSGTGLSGTADAPTLKCGGAIIDTVSYAAADGFPVPDDLDGHALQLDPRSIDHAANDAGASWCHASTVFFTSLDMANAGTPGAPNVECP